MVNLSKWVILIILQALSQATVAYNVHDSAMTSRSTPPIEVIGNKFFDSVTGDQFFIKGLAYQRVRGEGEVFDASIETSYLDSLSNSRSCLRDVERFKDLGINVVRVYQIDPNASHDICMEALSQAGIYVLADLSEPQQSINRDSPFWSVELFDRYKIVVDSMHKYDNLLGLFIGNEVTTSKVNTDASPFVRAAARDIHEYIQQKKYRKIPLGYATNDDAEIRGNISNYFICDDKDNDIVDFLGINMYEWCGYSTYATSGYRERTIEYSNFRVPIFFSEYGCNSVSPRPFTEVEALYGPSMSKVWSGGLAYEYFENMNHYGLVKNHLSDGQVTPLEDYQSFKVKMKSVSPVGVRADIDRKSGETKGHVKCEAGESWKASRILPPTPDSGKCECLSATFSCIVSPYKDVNEEQLLNEVCSLVDCTDIMANGESGVYGKYSDCGSSQKVSFALNKYYRLQGLDSKVCDFNGKAVLISNSDEVDLSNIFSQDGRSCQAAIGPSNSVISGKSNQVKNNSTTSSPYYSAYRERFNWTNKLNSEAGSVFDGLSSYINRCFLATCLFLAVV